MVHSSTWISRVHAAGDWTLKISITHTVIQGCDWQEYLKRRDWSIPASLTYSTTISSFMPNVPALQPSMVHRDSDKMVKTILMLDWLRDDCLRLKVVEGQGLKGRL